MNYKAQLRIPTNEQYAYIEPTVEGTPEEIVDAYYTFTDAVKNKEGLPRNEFNEIFDLVVQGKPIAGDPGILEQMSPAQRWGINEAKKSYKRRNIN